MADAVGVSSSTVLRGQRVQQQCVFRGQGSSMECSLHHDYQLQSLLLHQHRVVTLGGGLIWGGSRSCGCRHGVVIVFLVWMVCVWIDQG